MQAGSTLPVKAEPTRSITLGARPAVGFDPDVDILAPRQGPARQRDLHATPEPEVRDDTYRPPEALWERIAHAPWRAPASLSFAAQRFAQEDMTAGLHIQDFAPALRAYGRAGQTSGPVLGSAGLPIWA